jgi:hypothetical protein
MSGWGLSPWGLGPWGLGSATLLVANAYAAGDRFVRVQLSAQPLEASSTTVGSVYNPKTWTVTIPSTGRVLTVLSVTKYADKTYDILTLEMFDNHFVTMAVGSDTLKDASGVPAGLLTFGFKGAVLEATSTPQRKTTTRGFALRDLANPPTPNSPVGGTLEITSSGDYKTVEGPQFLRKLIIRRLTSKPGDFFHLPQYGIGLREKEPLPNNDLVKLKKAIEMQVELEPDVAAVKSRLNYDYAAAALIIQLQVQMKQTGQSIDIALPVPTGAVQL